MKKFLFIATICILCLASLQTQAQKIRFVNQNGDERFGKSKSTTDSTLTYIDSIGIEDNEGGVYEATVIGYAKDTAYSVTGSVAVRFNKRRGTLTMGSVVEKQAIVTDAALGTATFTIVASGGKIYTRVKGKAATNITWYCIPKRRSIIYK
mgnify:CR=1 FL=1